MKAIVQDRYGSADVLEARDIDAPQIGGWGGPGPRPRGVGPPRRLDPRVRLAVRHALRDRAAQAEAPGPGDRCGGNRRGGRHGRRATSAGRRGLRLVRRRVRRARGRSRGAARPQAGQPHLRAGGRRGRVRDRRAAAPPRQRQGPAGPEGPGQRRVGRRRQLRGADREVDGRRGDGRHQHEERGPGPLDRGRPRHRLHPGGLHRGRGALRPDPRQRRQPLHGSDAARADGRRDPDLQRRRARRRQARPHPAHDAGLDGRSTAGEPDGQDPEPRRPRGPEGARRGRSHRAGDRQHLPPRRGARGDPSRRGRPRQRHDRDRDPGATEGRSAPHMARCRRCRCPRPPAPDRVAPRQLDHG